MKNLEQKFREFLKERDPSIALSEPQIALVNEFLAQFEVVK